MIMLIRREIDNVFNYYIIRVINLLAHEQSSVYKDFYVSEVNECIGLNIENEDAVQSIITFSLLCDSSIYRYEARLTEKITINTEHSYWNDPKNYLIANVTQCSIFTNSTSYAQIELRVVKEGIEEINQSALYGVLFLLGILATSLLLVKYFCNEK